jgi:hypothetical protein
MSTHVRTKRLENLKVKMERNIEKYLEERKIAKTKQLRDFRDAMAYGYFQAYCDFCIEFGFDVDDRLLEEVMVPK